MRKASITERFRKIARQRDLTSMNKTGSTTRIIDDELEIERINLSIGETENFIALVEARKAEINEQCSELYKKVAENMLQSIIWQLHRGANPSTRMHLCRMKSST